MGVMSAREAFSKAKTSVDAYWDSILSEVNDRVKTASGCGLFEVAIDFQEGRLSRSTYGKLADELKSLGYSVVTPPQQKSKIRMIVSWECVV